ncbi:unnamed protein product [Penicillium roqueforti FM164]|uniref:Genomic scaffold, ProqFM164S01 n=1 Tax=Penicillium roqueforti (strain FM164) TaxID=1365484 RepID=W6PZ73_PENRF|nr:unnamed protein product [Penicillium roqueforti FM164]
MTRARWLVHSVNARAVGYLDRSRFLESDVILHPQTACTAMETTSYTVNRILQYAA